MHHANISKTMRIVIIGGGITGLSAAHRLIELRSEKNLPIEVVLLEGDGRVGGTIATQRLDGFLIEEGADSFITTKPCVLSLCKRIGLDSSLIQTNDAYRRTFVIHRGRLIPIPEGFLMIAPTRFLPFLTSSLFSWRGKLRMMMDLVMPRASRREDESLASFVTRRFGREALERAAQPLIGGIYTADPELLSLRATMPRFLEMEREHGSVIKAMLYEQRSTQKRQGEDSGARYSLFMSLKDGMQTLVDTLAARLPQGAIQLNQRVKSLVRANRGWNVITDDARLDADGVIIAIPAHHAAALSEGFDSSLSADLAKIQYASSAVVSLAYRCEDIPHPLNGFGFVVPIIEKRAIIACSFSSVKFAGRAPEGGALLRCFVGGAMQPEIYEWDDRALVEAAHKEMRDLLGITAAPLFAFVHRYPKSMPQYPVGHLQHIAQINAKVSKHRGLALSGNAYGGVGIPDCIRAGEAAAEALVMCLGLMT
jgi:oxygen-dependent protoporphyrinogen oxidase